MLYERRIGQMNLACLYCHEQNAGRRLLAETISQGHSNAYPIYRLEWQALGSLQRRLRACYSGVRAELPAYNAPDLLDLSLFLAWRGEGLAVHVASCSVATKLMQKDNERFIAVEWSDEPLRAFATTIVITVQSGKGVLAKVAAAMASAEADIKSVDLGRDSEVGAPTADLRFVIDVRDTAHLQTVLRTLSRTASVNKALRVLG